MLAKSLNRIIQQALALDPQIGERLAKHQGRSVELISENQGGVPDLSLHLTIERASVTVNEGPAPSPSAIIKGKPKALARMALGGELQDVTISGDMTIVQELQAVFRSYRPDLVTPLERLLGEQGANMLAATLELGVASLTQLQRGATSKAFQQAETLFAEQFATRDHFAVLQQRTDNVRLALDRLAARTGRLERPLDDEDS